jgi:putative transferase (TIGR04331 family)
MARFLVTTSEEKTWKTDEKILFLGEWCKRLRRKEIWSQLDYKVLPYHWDDRNRMFSDYQYLQGIYEKYLGILSKRMNRIHDVSHSTEYWRIVLGPWLQLFIGIVFDKWLSIKRAIDTEEISSTWILDFGQEGIVPYGMNELKYLFSSQEWNHHIYSQIIIANKEIPYKKIEQNLIPKSFNFRNTSALGFKSFLKMIASRIYRLVPDRLNKNVFISTNFSKWDLIKLQISLGQMPYLVTSEMKLEEVSVCPGMRKDLEMNEASSEFEIILEKLIPGNIPKANVECRSKICNNVILKYPKKVSTIITTHGYWVNDDLKLWIAEKKAQGSTLVISQHGGLFGSGLIEQSEVHQIKISDRFYTWGWKDEKHSHVQPLSPPKLSLVTKKGIFQKRNGSILWVWGADFPNFYFRMHSVPISSQGLEYTHDQIKFGKNLSEDVLEILKLRLRPNPRFLWEQDQYIKDAGLDKNIERNSKNLYQQLNESRLCVTTDNSSVFLETLSINFPTILFWNPKHWEVRSEAEPYYDLLRKTGILYDTPEAAAEKINDIYINPMEWWLQPDVQKARSLFCQKYAYLNEENWLQEWKTALNEISKLDK